MYMYYNQLLMIEIRKEHLFDCSKYSFISSLRLAALRSDEALTLK